MSAKVSESYSWEDTFFQGESMAKEVKPGTVICLSGDLGAGKTVFTKGFAKGLGISEPVNSPTFTIVQEYHTGRLPFYHFDVYRLGSSWELEDIGCDEYFYGQGVCLIEWAELVKDIIPEGSWTVNIEKNLKRGADYRRITVKAPSEFI